jgi:iron only hydrogenase large subunit-like protein
MPCFDKKLEASRKDFLSEEFNVKDVDCVLATTEIIELIASLNVDFMSLEPAVLSPQEIMLSGISEDGSAVLGSSVNASSGGPLEHIFRYAAKELFNVDVNGPLEYVVGRNPDFREVTLVIEGQEVLKFAIAYGFRNIQSIMTKIRRNKCPYHYVEIMACPSGCLNGGGQIKPKSTLLASELLANVTSRFQELQVRAPTDNPACKYVYEKYFAGQPFSDAARQAFHTRYHAVPKLEQSNPLGIKW